MSSLQYKQSNGPKLSMLYIEQAYFYRIQIKSLANMYKLNVRLKKPIILSLYSLPVLKYIIDHSQSLNSILQMENIHEIKLCVPGYGIFNQKYQLQRISNLFQIFANYCQHISLSIKKITLQFPGWRAFTNQVINSIFKFIKNCQTLQQFSLNLNHNMNLSANKAISDDQVNMKQIQQQTFYGKYMFETPQFDNLMKSIAKYLPANTVNKIQLRFGAWQTVSNSIVQILIDSIKKIYQNIKYLKIMKLDIHGWGTGNYDSTDRQIKYDTVEKLFRTIEQFDGETSQLLQVDMRYWPSKFKISKFKERFQYLSGGMKRKDENTSSMGGWTMTGTNFFGSQLKGKLMNKMKIEIKD